MRSTDRRDRIMRVRTTSSLAAALLVTAVLTVAPPASAATAPTVLASTGDSITRAFDVSSSTAFKDAPPLSWSTGTDSRVTSVLAHLGGTTKVTPYNDAATGKKMIDLDGQLRSAAAQGADGVTVLMGANDLCTSSASTMTAASTFRSQFQTALSDFFAARPGATVAVSSIPNIYNLWSVLHTSSSARFTWAVLGECRSMLASSNTEAQRQLVVAREALDNQALADVCATFASQGCHWDGLAVYNTRFSASQISTVDYFHPNIAGQNTLASVAWSSGPWQ